MARTFASASSQALNGTLRDVASSDPAVTFAAWVKGTASSADAQDLVVAHSASGVLATDSIGLSFAVVAATLRFRMRTETSGVSGTTVVGTTLWRHVVGVQTAVNARELFVNGVSEGTSSTVRACANLAQLSVGGLHSSSPERYADVQMGEIAVWAVGLTPAEVLMLSLGVSPLLIRPASLAHYIPGVRGAIDHLGPAFTEIGSPGTVEHPRVIYPRRRVISVDQAAGGGGGGAKGHYYRFLLGLRRAA